MVGGAGLALVGAGALWLWLRDDRPSKKRAARVSVRPDLCGAPITPLYSMRRLRIVEMLGIPASKEEIAALKKGRPDLKNRSSN